MASSTARPAGRDVASFTTAVANSAMKSRARRLPGVLEGGAPFTVTVDVHEHMSEQGWSDGLPLVPPTKARVKHMLTGTARDAIEVLGHCAPMYGEVTVEKVAINAVMAGCEPKHLRLVLA